MVPPPRAESSSSLLYAYARSSDLFTQHQYKVGPNTETEQLFKSSESFESPNPLKGADVESHASEWGQRALSPPTRRRATGDWRVEFSPQLKLIITHKHSLVDGEQLQDFQRYWYHFFASELDTIPAAYWYLSPNVRTTRSRITYEG